MNLKAKIIYNYWFGDSIVSYKCLEINYSVYLIFVTLNSFLL